MFFVWLIAAPDEEMIGYNTVGKRTQKKGVEPTYVILLRGSGLPEQEIKSSPR